LILLHYPIHV